MILIQYHFNKHRNCKTNDIKKSVIKIFVLINIASLQDIHNIILTYISYIHKVSLWLKYVFIMKRCNPFT